MIVVGLGARSRTTSADLAVAVHAALAAAGIGPDRVAVLATLDRRAAEDGMRDLARRLGWRLAGFPAGELAAQPVPSPPGEIARSAVGTPSVAEAAALLAAGPGSRLILPKQIFGRVTAAVARAGAAGTPA